LLSVNCALKFALKPVKARNQFYSSTNKSLTMRKIIFTITIALFVYSGVNAQQSETDLVRTAFKQGKKEEVASFMRLRDADAKKFWPIYDEYEAKRTALGDRRVKLLENYAAAYSKRDTAAAEKIWKDHAKIQKDEIALREKYADVLKKKVSSSVALNFFMVEDYINTAVKFLLYNSIPPPEM